MLHPWSALSGACDTVGQVTQLAIVNMANLLQAVILTSDNSIMHIIMHAITLNHKLPQAIAIVS